MFCDIHLKKKVLLKYVFYLIVHNYIIKDLQQTVA